MDLQEPGILGGPDFTSSILMTDAFDSFSDPSFIDTASIGKSTSSSSELPEHQLPAFLCEAEGAQPRTGIEGALAKFIASNEFYFHYGATFLPLEIYEEKFLSSCPGEEEERATFYMSDQNGLESGIRQRSLERDLRIAFNEISLDPKIAAMHVHASPSGICIVASGERKQDTLGPIKRMRNIYIR